MGVLFLACAVFGWGLQYKMSLYGPTNGLSTATPHAKLLSQKERLPSNQQVVSFRSASALPQSSVLYALLLIAALAVSLPHLAMVWMQTAKSHYAASQQRRARLNYFSLRPPPASIPSY
jgi:hypothetical protein